MKIRKLISNQSIKKF